MAVYAAHLTRTLQGTPSVFQVTAQEALGATVKPALRKLLEYLAAAYPNKCGWCERWYDELYLLLDCCLQYHYLKHYAASFSESFYGLIRVPIKVSGEFNTGQRLPYFLENCSLALLVLVPYLKDKIEAIVDDWREQIEDGAMGKSKYDKARRAAVRVYSVVHLVTDCIALIQLGSFLTRRSQSHSPSLALLGITLKDAPPKQQDDYNWSDLLKSVFSGQIGRSVVTFPMLGGALLRGAEYGAFLVQLLRWWHAAPAARPATAPPPPPPQIEANATKWTNKCPVCLHSWRIPTVLPVSGYIFCYVCISRHVRTHGTCPVSRLPAREHTLVRLYID